MLKMENLFEYINKILIINENNLFTYMKAFSHQNCLKSDNMWRIQKKDNQIIKNVNLKNDFWILASQICTFSQTTLSSIYAKIGRLKPFRILVLKFLFKKL